MRSSGINFINFSYSLANVITPPNENENPRSSDVEIENEINALKSELGESKNNFNLLQARLAEVQDGLVKAYKDLSSLRSKIRHLCSKLKESDINDETCN